MRTLLVIALGVLSFGNFFERALAAKAVVNCERMLGTCMDKYPKALNSCGDAYMSCSADNKKMGYDEFGKRVAPPDNPKPPNNTVIIPPSGDPPKGVGGESDVSSGDSFLPFKGLSTSKPTGRTINGKVEMVTESGKIWRWNGKTTQVMVLNASGRQQYITVRQGDPDVHMTAVVDGKTYNVASPGYAAAIARKQAQAPKPRPSPPPGDVCAGWGCPDPGPRTSTVVQESGVQKPKSPAPSAQVGGLPAGGNLQTLNNPGAAPAAATAPLSVQGQGTQPAYTGLPRSQQYKFQNKQF